MRQDCTLSVFSNDLILSFQVEFLLCRFVLVPEQDSYYSLAVDLVLRRGDIVTKPVSARYSFIEIELWFVLTLTRLRILSL